MGRVVFVRYQSISRPLKAIFLVVVLLLLTGSYVWGVKGCLSKTDGPENRTSSASRTPTVRGGNTATSGAHEDVGVPPLTLPKCENSSKRASSDRLFHF